MGHWKKKLQNPFALVGEGFVVGVLLFWATASHDASAAAPARTAGPTNSVTASAATR
jgi:hypothetical protein